MAGTVAVLLGGLAFSDVRLKRADSSGYCPQDATWACFASDFGVLWQSAADLDTWTAVRPHLLPLMRRLELAAYRAIHIRPTPARFNLWMGHGLLAAGNADATGYCIKPGVLMRALLWLRGSGTAREDGILRDGDWFFAWRDGFLVFSESREYVRTALAAPLPALLEIGPPEVLVVRLSESTMNQPLIELNLSFAPGVPVAGLIHTTSPDRAHTFPGAKPLYPESIMEVQTATAAGLATIAGTMSSALPRIDLLDPVMPFLRSAVEQVEDRWAFRSWARAVGQPDRPLKVALADVVVDGLVPVPVVGCAMGRLPEETTHPLSSIEQFGEGIPHEWNGAEGVLIPVLGDALTICLAGTRDYWLTTSTEPLMAALVAEDAALDAAADQTDLRLAVQWPQLASAVARMAQPWVTEDWTPDLDPEALSQLAQQLTGAMNELGTMSLSGRFTNRGLAIVGDLCRQETP